MASVNYGVRPGRKPRVLVVSQEASRTGAPRVAIQILDALAGDEWERQVVLRWEGPLRQGFATTGSKVVLEPFRLARAALRMWAPTRPLATWLEQLAAALVIVALRPDLVWCNTVLSACYVRPASLAGKRVVLHAHEPGERMVQVLGRYRLARYWESTVLVGCAPRVRSDLARATGRRIEDVVYLPSVPDWERIHDLAKCEVPSLPPHGVLIGACGTSDERKGVDLWLNMIDQVGPAVADLDPHFVWIGGDPSDGFDEWAAASSFGGRVTFTGSLDNPYPLLAALDVFTLPSRCDAFPLVVLEAMNLARPVVAFEVGDVAEQLGSNGRLVPPLDTTCFAEAVIGLLRDPSERERLGRAGEARAREHFPSQAFVAGVREITSQLVRPASGRRR
jgi:glycosyltransferase involved in cell wall biosynthesis